MIEVKHLVKRYGENYAVDDLSFTVERGQIYGFLGPNGAGKSTTMNILTGYIAPSLGEVKINGFDILDDAEKARRCIGYLPEIPPIYPDMTVYEYLAFVGDLKKIRKKERQEMIAGAMELTGLVEVHNRLIKNLSKGYRQRVGLAQAILGFPEIIILDEPMVGLDPKQIIEIRELIRKLSQKHTVILSSHILSEISAICDHIMIIAHGKLVASDTPENLTKLMRGSASLELTVRGSKGKLRQVLEEIGAVSSFQISDSSEREAYDVKIQSEGDADLREQLFYRLAEQKMPLLRMQHTHVSLEDVFLELTGEQEEKPNGGADKRDDCDTGRAEDPVKKEDSDRAEDPVQKEGSGREEDPVQKEDSGRAEDPVQKEHSGQMDENDIKQRAAVNQKNIKKEDGSDDSNI